MTTPHDGSSMPWTELDLELAGPRPPAPGPERGDDAAGSGPALPSTRRTFLKTLGVGTAGSLAACSRLPVKSAIPYLVPPEEITPGVAVHYASTCTACPASCGLLVTVRDGRPVKLEGNPDHPLSGGGLCAMGQADLRALYDPDRLKAPEVAGRVATWDELDRAVEAGLAEAVRGGKKLYLLTGSVVGPAARAAAGAFAARHGATWVEHEPDPASPPSALLEAHALLLGRPLAPSWDLSKADVWVSLGSDLLGAGPEPVAHTRAWAARRRGPRPAPTHVQVEGTLTLTGAAADLRIPAGASERRALALATCGLVAGRLGHDTVAAAIPAPDGNAHAEALAARLVEARGRSLVTSGANDVAEQVAVLLLNRMLGNEGVTVDVAAPTLVRRGLDAELVALLEDLAAGRAGGLVIVERDPLGEIPGGAALAKAIADLPFSVALATRATATTAACRIVAPAHHGLERWGDAEVRPGQRTLAQPVIRPLFDTRDPWDGIARWAGESVHDGRSRLMAAWKALRPATAEDGDGFWVDAVRRGGLGALPPSPAEFVAAGPLPDAALAALSAPAPPAPALELELCAEVGRRDGSRSHVPWLEELPDPLTRASWIPLARVAPSRARALHVVDGDVVELRRGGAKVTMAVRVQPGQAPGVIGIPVGYGRRGGDGGPAEHNAYALASLDGGRRTTSGLAVEVAATGAKERLPLMQVHDSPEGRPVVHQVASADAHVPEAHAPHGVSLWPERPAASPQWEMVIDLDACTGCSACVVACQVENNVAVVGRREMEIQRDMHWLRMDRYYTGSPDAPDVLFQPMLCAQCGHAPCETVCPVAATVHSVDGLNQQVYNRCVGTRYCANNCPYKARRFNWFGNEPTDAVERMVLNPDVVVRSRGVMEKCTFCVQRIQKTRLDARREGRPEPATPVTACQQTCPAQAIVFGDGSDPEGPVARLKARSRAFRVLAELGVDPSVTYLAKVRNREDAGPEPGASPHGGHA